MSVQFSGEKSEAAVKLLVVHDDDEVGPLGRVAESLRAETEDKLSTSESVSVKVECATKIYVICFYDYAASRLPLHFGFLHQMSNFSCPAFLLRDLSILVDERREWSKLRDRKLQHLRANTCRTREG